MFYSKLVQEVLIEYAKLISEVARSFRMKVDIFAFAFICGVEECDLLPTYLTLGKYLLKCRVADIALP